MITMMKITVLYALLVAWAIASPIALDDDTDVVSQALGLGTKAVPDKVLISRVDDGPTEADQPPHDEGLEEDIAMYNALNPENQIPGRIMANPPGDSQSNNNEGPVQFHEYELFSTMEHAANLLRADTASNSNTLPTWQGVRWPRIHYPEQHGIRRVEIGETNWWEDLIYEFPMLPDGRVFDGGEAPGEHFIIFSIRDFEDMSPRWNGFQTGSGHQPPQRHWCPEVHYNGEVTEEASSQSGYDVLLRYIIPFLFVRSWNPANPFDKRRQLRKQRSLQ
ncbi:hypothetical protein F5X99DRAFT_413410 [Biscogniauxia marginata]|nr:hypothetical protein F5X99DRAFT_413410 [Biscogniauxia marginata]